MGAILAANVTYAIKKRKKLDDGRKIVQLDITFGNGTLTYPTGGVPLTIGNMGLPTLCESFQVDDNGGSVYRTNYVKSTQCLQLLSIASHSHDLFFKDGTVADAAGARVNIATDKMGANLGADKTVHQGGANGGVVASAAGTDPASQEVASTVAPAAQTFHVTVIGY